MREAIDAKDSAAAQPLALLMAAWLVDYRAAEGDGVAPFLQAAGVGLTLLALAHHFSRPRDISTRTRNALTVAVAFVVYALAVGVIQGQAPAVAAKAAVPPLLFSVGLAIGYQALRAAPTEHVRDMILAFAFASALLKPVTWYFGSAEVELSEVRYQILSGSLPFLIAYCIVAFSARFTVRDAAILVAVTALIAASVTRTYLVVAAVMVAAQLALSPRTFTRMRSIGTALGILALIAVIGLFGDASLADVVERWEARIAYSDDLGFDLTAASRIAEAEFQLDSIRSSATTAIVGNGIGARTQLSGEYADLFYAVAPNHEVSSIGFGHTDQTSILFVGGLIVGGLFLVLTLRLVYWGFCLLKRWLYAVDERRDIAFVGCWGATTVIGVTVYGVFGGTFGDRSASMHYGIAAAMVLWAMDRSAPCQESQT
jgi:hypothetical protein